MNNESFMPNPPLLFEGDLKRTARPAPHNLLFYWVDDILILAGQGKSNMAKALSPLSPSLKSSLKQHLISFTTQGDYAPNTYITIFAALSAALNAHPTRTFDTRWMAQALTKPSVQNVTRGMARFFLHWKERDSAAISQDAWRLLNDTATHQRKARNVLSDNPKRSWLTDEEYDRLLSAVWTNYDRGMSSTQVTLIRLLSLQYARRPVQIAYLKVGDIREVDRSDNLGFTGRIIDFPGVKDIHAETDFRDSKFEPHPLADHLWDLCHVHFKELRALYEYTLGISLTDAQMKTLPLFCSEARLKETRQFFADRLELNLLESLDSRLFHLRKVQISNILTWLWNTPTCDYAVQNRRWALRPKPPISPRTGEVMVVSATRVRHTRARQLARQGVPKHVLSHWMGHTSQSSLDAYYNDPAEQARQLDEVMAPVLTPLAMLFAGTLIDTEAQATRATDPNSNLEFACAGELKSVGRCGKHSFCATTSVPIPCYRCKHFEPLVDAPHGEVLEALLQRQAAENEVLKIGSPRNLLIPIDLSHEIRAVRNCIAACNARQAEREKNL
ncbi:site-specific integrase [Pseudomonas sp. ITA]|uniref:site-specific integrase n=1 Tax=Pseudomonas sp. ITA TaxID=2825841 RepID=UPI0024986AA7|nr:site-specific integrase [Pseudomonas sp. ITA]MDI2146176.1 site-specific integrase [Pseudomonas sp. ITA]